MSKDLTSFGSDFVIFLLKNKHQTFLKVISFVDSSFLKEAVNCEIESILNNHIWKLIDLPPRNKPLGSKYIFKKKVYGVINKYKARLVVKGYK